MPKLSSFLSVGTAVKVGAGVVQKVQIVEEPADLKIEQREAVIPAENQTDYVPKRPAVFDGRGNAPVVTNKSSTNGAEPQLLYFNDPSFATGRTPSTDGRDVRPPLSPTVPNARRFADLKPQHVVSVKATPEGVVVREGRAWTLSSSPEARFGTASDISGAGAEKMDEKGDATTVTLHGRGPKPPSDGKGSVLEAERNAFNEQKRIFEERKETFEREKSEKEKELADKEKDLEVRKKFLDLREENKDDAADLFDLSKRQTIQRAEDFYILREEKEPYEIEKQNEEGMTIERQPKPELVYERRDTVEINAKKKGSLYQEQIITSIDLPGKERAENGIESTNSIKLAHEEPKKTENAISSDKGFEIQAKPSAKLVKPNLPSQQFNFSLSVKKKVDPTVTDTFKTPSKKKDNDADQSKVKTKKSQTKRKKRDLLNLYDNDGFFG